MKKKYYLSLLIIFVLSSCSFKVGPSSPTDPVDPSDPEEYIVIDSPVKRMPAEFEPVSMVKMIYPFNIDSSVYVTISKETKILLLCNYDSYGKSTINKAKSSLNSLGANMSNISFLDMDLDDGNCWIRDCSPFYIFNESDLEIVDFTYNRPYRVNQNKIPSKLASYFSIDYSLMDLVHTGGNLMQDGRGTAFSDDLVISENNNNETKVREQMKQYTGTDNYVITIDPQGDYIAHIDCWAKIVAVDKIIVAQVPKSNPQYEEYESVANLLANTKCAYGYNYKIYRIEEPGGDIIAPYTNSLIANNNVYVPMGEDETYNTKALNLYKSVLPGYTVTGVYSSSGYNSFLNTDALHCRTHEVPDQNMIFIDSRDVYSGLVDKLDSYLVKANVISYSGSKIKSAKIYYSINNNEYVSLDLAKYQDTSNYTYTFENLNHGDDVKYYLEVEDNLGNKQIDPSCGKLDPHHFAIR